MSALGGVGGVGEKRVQCTLLPDAMTLLVEAETLQLNEQAPSNNMVFG